MIPLFEMDWGKLECAYASRSGDIPKQLEKLRVTENDKEIQSLMGELIANVNHQCDFYSSTMVVISYLSEFMKARREDFKYVMTIISYIAAFYSNETEVKLEPHLRQWYDESIAYTKNALLGLMRSRYQDVVAFAQENVDLSLGAFLALLDGSAYGKLIARQMCFGNFDELSLLCTNCDFEDEMLPLDDASLKEAAVDAAKWDRIDYSDTAVWIYNIYADRLDHRIIQWALKLLGIFTCPECGTGQPAIECVKNYIEAC